VGFGALGRRSSAASGLQSGDALRRRQGGAGCRSRNAWHRTCRNSSRRHLGASHSGFRAKTHWINLVIASAAWRSSAARSERAALDCFASASQ
jgi:hypothetical protein